MILVGEGIRIKTLRLAAGLSQRRLAEESGVTPKTIRRMESGKTCIPKSVFAIASVLGADPKELAHRRKAGGFRPALKVVA